MKPARLPHALRRLARKLSAPLRDVGGRAALSLQQQRLVDFAMASGDWLWETDFEDRVVWVSATDHDRFGMQSLWVTGERLPDERLLDAGGEPLTPTISLLQLMHQRHPFQRAITLWDSPAGRRYVSLSGVCRFEAGRWCGFRGTARDVSAAVAAQRERESSADVLRKLSEHIPGLLFQYRMHADGRIQLPYASERLREILEVEPDAAARDASCVIDRLHCDDAPGVLAAVAQSAVDMRMWEQRFRVLLPVRGERVLEGRAMPERLAEGSVLWHGMISDVTQQLQDARQVETLARERDSARRAAQLRSELMSRVSHELRTPLNAILGFAQLIERNRSETANESAVVSAVQIQRAGKHLLSLINDMLDLSSLEAKGLTQDLQPLALAPLVERCIELMMPSAQQRPVRLSCRIAASLPAANAELRAFKQVLFNLIGNAIKFSPPGSSVEVDAQPDASGAWVLVSVRDDGAGIAAERMASLFQPFTRLPEKGAHTEGSGLGLAISQRLALAMGGRIDVASEPGRGSVFTLRLAATDLEPLPSGDTGFGMLEALQSPPTFAGRVLYIEDEPINALLMQQFCSAYPGLELTVASTGGEGLALARALIPQLVLLDMNLPDMSGHQVLEALRSDPATAAIRIVALSADALDEHKHAARAVGFDDYWTKPIDFTVVEQGLQAWLGRRGD